MIAKYKNGNYTVEIFEDGTKIRTLDEGQNSFRATLPESMDLKITNFCDAGHICKYCHEASHLRGKHGDLKKVVSFLNGLPHGVEIAIGGGNPLTHPDIVWFLKELKDRGLIGNLTVNHVHLGGYQKLIEILISDGLVKGLGISYRRGYDTDLVSHFSRYVNTVFHLIAGVDYVQNIYDLTKVIAKGSKFLILGYKDFRKGISFHSPEVDKSISEWYSHLPLFVNKVIKEGGVVSFDNLAIKQLNVKRLTNQAQWDEFYQGDDGGHTFYIDGVKEEFALCSTASKRFKCEGSVVDMFQRILSND